TGDASYVIVAPKSAILVSDQRFEVQIKEECPEIGTGPDLELYIRPHNKTTTEAAADAITKLGVKSVAVEGNRITVSELEALRSLAAKATFVPMSDLVEALRSVKDMGEVEKIREAVRVAERAFKMFTATLRPADTEKDMVDA